MLPCKVQTNNFSMMALRVPQLISYACFQPSLEQVQVRTRTKASFKQLRTGSFQEQTTLQKHVIYHGLL